VFKFVLTNLQGSIVKQDKYTTNKAKYENETILNIDISDVSSGVYLLKMQTPDGRIITQKIMITK
jgi:hypothetical protein